MCITVKKTYWENHEDMPRMKQIRSVPCDYRTRHLPQTSASISLCLIQTRSRMMHGLAQTGEWSGRLHLVSKKEANIVDAHKLP